MKQRHDRRVFVTPNVMITGIWPCQGSRRRPPGLTLLRRRSPPPFSAAQPTGQDPHNCLAIVASTTSGDHYCQAVVTILDFGRGEGRAWSSGGGEEGAGGVPALQARIEASQIVGSAHPVPCRRGRQIRR